MSKEIPCQCLTLEKGLVRHYAFSERKEEAHGSTGGRGRGELREDRLWLWQSVQVVR